VLLLGLATTVIATCAPGRASHFLGDAMVEAGRALSDAGRSDAHADDLDGGDACVTCAGPALPPGTVIAFAGPRVPEGWLLCDGQHVERALYPELFAAIGSVHGSGDGATTFTLPDLRGRFLRGVDSGAGRDPDARARSAAAPGGNEGDSIGTVEGFATAMPARGLATESAGDHTHTFRASSGSEVACNGSICGGFVGADTTSTSTTGSAGAHSHAITGGDAETRPENVALAFIIKT